MKSWGIVSLVVALAAACTFSPNNPSRVIAADAARCGDAADASDVGDACGDCAGPERAVCSGACVSLVSDLNCGACGVACATTAGARCVRSSAGVRADGGGARVAVCQTDCSAGQVLCGAACRDLTTDNTHCGACGRVCPGGQSCRAGICAATCAAGQAVCSGVCRDLTTDNANCGACGNVCPGGQTCAAGACTTTCSAAQTDCAGTCRDLATDNTNCGACGNACAAGTVCSAGACTATCASPTTVCAGVCRDLQNDANHCSACGAVCTRANGVAGCVGGACTLAACNAGFADCDGNNANGCETSTATSVTNCGACGNGCQFANAAASCVAGVCTRGACAMGFGNCDGVNANGCEVNTATGDIAHCGACNNRCPTPPVGATAVCSNSTCTVSSVSCPSGTADCDGVPGNGCEVSTTTASHCGGCGRACVATNGTATCTAQVCGITCSAGFGNCNGTLADGCETNTGTSANNCGACNSVCSLPNATAGCAAGACTLASCNAGFANCDGATANGCERNLNSDASHCGACGNACGAGQVCSAGVCLSTCGPGQTNCSSVCRNLATDPDACGACGAVCSAVGIVSRTCGGGVCNGTCATGRGNCDGNLQSNGCETDINTSVTRCGGCTGSACSVNNILAVCLGGSCLGICRTGYADCDGDKRSNGCETNLTNSAGNCGGCGASFACPARANAAATPCVSSTCTLGACNAGFGNCDGMVANGCEVSTGTDPLNCGLCGTVCPTRPNATPDCVGGACGLTCAPGFGDCNSDPVDGCEAPLDVDGDCGACGQFCTGGTMCRPRLGTTGLFICR